MTRYGESDNTAVTTVIVGGDGVGIGTMVLGMGTNILPCHPLV